MGREGSVSDGGIRVPGDKSITHRALMLAALASGPCRLGGALAAGDTTWVSLAVWNNGLAPVTAQSVTFRLTLDGAVDAPPECTLATQTADCADAENAKVAENISAGVSADFSAPRTNGNFVFSHAKQQSNEAYSQQHLVWQTSLFRVDCKYFEVQR